MIQSHDVSTPEFLFCNVKHMHKIRPLDDIGSNKHSASFPLLFGRVGVQDFLCFGTEAKVCDHNIATSSEKHLCE